MTNRNSAADLDLLRTYEPILCFTRGEAFFPMSIEPYVNQSSLWTRPPTGQSKQLVEEGCLNARSLSDHGNVPAGHTVYVRFVDEPYTAIELQRWLRTSERKRFRAPSRLSRVGMGPRLADAIFSLSLLLRGRVPGGTAAKATAQYQKTRREHPEYVYYGRVVPAAGYLVLHYMFFYPMNDWRSSFDGANDHEADWEQLFVFLDENPGGEPFPVWVACAAHDAFGDDLRRRWDDPDLTFIDNHPVVYIGAGSHATYFIKGEYLTPVEIRFMRPVVNVFSAIERVWRDTLKQGVPGQTTSRLQDVMKIPFVDYARGDGLRIGPDQDATWSPQLISDEVDWVHRYRGLWGLDTRDRFGGERAPAGPKYNRDGTVRLSWNNPLGWSGLEKVPPPSVSSQLLLARVETLQSDRCAIDDRIAVLQGVIPTLDLEVRALQQSQHLAGLLSDREQHLRDQVVELNNLYRDRIDLEVRIEACSSLLAQLERGEQGDPKTHIHHLLVPQREPDLRRGTIAEVWSALSVGLLLLAILAEIVFGFTSGLLIGVSIALGAFILIEATLHKRLEKLLLNVTMILALVSSAVLVYEFYLYIILVIVAAIAVVVTTDNLRELRRR